MIFIITGLSSFYFSQIKRHKEGNKNPKVQKALQKDGSNLKDWNKMKAKIGDKEVHYYQNSKTGKVHYDNDYKTIINNKTERVYSGTKVKNTLDSKNQ